MGGPDGLMGAGARAEFLVRDEANAVMQLEVLRFELGGHDFALATADVAELLRAVSIQALPRAPAIVEGVINVRGAVMPVLDIRARFGLPARCLTATDHLIVLATEPRAALRVDRCISIATLDVIRQEDAADLPRGVRLVLGFAPVPEGLLVIADLRSFLSETEARALTAALAPQRARSPGVIA
jgi:purine-binding chemotaxis protein CheW